MVLGRSRIRGPPVAGLGTSVHRWSDGLGLDAPERSGASSQLHPHRRTRKPTYKNGHGSCLGVRIVARFMARVTPTRNVRRAWLMSLSVAPDQINRP